MNKKTLNKVLLLLMITIWAVVFNKIFNFFGNKEKNTSIVYSPSVKKPSYNFSKDTFHLQKIVRDPFLGKISDKKQKKTQIKLVSKKTINNKKQLPVASHTPWPKCSYHGYVKGVKSNFELILVKIGSRLHKAREGNVINNILIKKVYKDSIILKRGKENKVVKKSR